MASLFRGALFEPLLFIGREIDGADPIGHPHCWPPVPVRSDTAQSHADLLVFGGIEHLNKGAGAKAGAALLQGFAVHHPRFLGRHCTKGAVAPAADRVPPAMASSRPVPPAHKGSAGRSGGPHPRFSASGSSAARPGAFAADSSPRQDLQSRDRRCGNSTTVTMLLVNTVAGFNGMTRMATTDWMARRWPISNSVCRRSSMAPQRAPTWILFCGSGTIPPVRDVANKEKAMPALVWRASIPPAC